MVKLFDGSFNLGAVLVFAALALAYAARFIDALPVIGSGRGALLAVAVLGVAACSVAGVSQAPALGWAHPVTILGSVLGAIALLIIAAGLFGWDGVIRACTQLVPGAAAAAATTEQLAIVVLAAVLALKWVIGVVLAIARG